MMKKVIFIVFLVSLNVILAKDSSEESEESEESNESSEGKKGFKCPEDDGMFKNDDCTKFWHCSNGNPYEKECPSILHWNDKKKECDWPDKAGCNSVGTPTTTEDSQTDEETTTVPEETTTETDETTTEADETTTGTDETTTEADADETTTEADADETTTEADADETTTGADETTTGAAETTTGAAETTTGAAETTTGAAETTTRADKTTTPDDIVSCDREDAIETGYFPHKDCWKFWQCSNGVPYEMECAKGTAWNQQLLTCDWPENVNCIIPGQNRKICKNAGSYYQDRKDCRYFYQCDLSYNAHRKQCADGLYFNEEDSKCDFAQFVKCYDGSNLKFKDPLLTE